MKDGRVEVVAGPTASRGKSTTFSSMQTRHRLRAPFTFGPILGPGPGAGRLRLASEKSGRRERRSERRWTPAELAALDFDGALANPGPGRKGPGLSGSATISAAYPAPKGRWPGGRPADEIDLDRATIDNAEFRSGPEERALTADGAAILTYASPAQLAIEVKAKQANLDALLRRKEEDGVAPARAVALLSGALAPILARTSLVSVEAKLDAETIILGADTVSDVSASVRSRLSPAACPLRSRPSGP